MKLHGSSRMKMKHMESNPCFNEGEYYVSLRYEEAEILVNGFRRDKINIEHSVKQGNTLSCSLFILCIDPLIRKVNDQNLSK